MDTDATEIDEKKLAVIRALTIMLAEEGSDSDKVSALKARLHQGYDPSSEHAERSILVGQNIYQRYSPLEQVTLLGEFGGRTDTALPTTQLDLLTAEPSFIIPEAAPLSLAPLIDVLPAGAMGLPFVLVRGLAGAGASIGAQVAPDLWLMDVSELRNLSVTPTAALQLALLPIGLLDDDLLIGAPTTIPVGPAANPPTVSILAASGNEDNAISLSITVDLTTPSTNGNLVIVISGLPAGASLSAGTQNADGSWSLSPADLNNLTLIPPPYWSGSLSLTVSATNTENGVASTVSTGLPVDVHGVANTPVVTVTAAVGMEDHAIPLSINAASPDTDGSETLTVRIVGLPSGSVLSAGALQADGSWLLSAANLAGLTVTPPTHWSGSLNLTITATTTEDGTTASRSVTMPLSVAGVATAPSLSVTAATGTEDHAIPLTINAALTDTDGSETLTVIISGLPAGTSLSAGTHNPDGSWTLTAADLVGLTLTPPQYWSGSFSLTVTAQSNENGSTATTTAQLPIHIDGTVGTPHLTASAGSGTEDTPVALNITAVADDNDGSETVTVVIGGLPPGASLSAGTLNPDGTWTLLPSELPGLMLNPPPHASGSFNITVTAVATEAGHTAISQGTLPISVTGVATTPSLTLSAANGNEGAAIPIAIQAALVDTDGSETLSVTITGVPAGASLSAGTRNPDGSWTLAPGDLAGLTFTPPTNWSGSVSLTVTATSSENGSTASVSGSLPISVSGVATTPSVSASAASGGEDTSIPLSINATLVDNDGSETLSVTISGLPAGSQLSAGHQNPDGSWTLAPGDLAGLILTPPAHWSGSANIVVTATSSENGSTASTATTLPLTVSGSATSPNLSATPATGAEDHAIALNINATLADTDGSETLTIVIDHLPAGATLSAGMQQPDGSWLLSPADLAGLTLLPASGWSGTANLSITAISHENGSTAATNISLPLSVSGVASPPHLSVLGTSGNEDSAIPLPISASLADTDGSETLSITIGGIPAGGTLSAGTRNADGSWTLSPADLAGLTFTPPPGFSGSLNLSVAATSSENGTTSTVSASLPIAIAGVASPPNLVVGAATGAEDTAISLPISAALTDTDGSETLSVTITGVPAGATLSAGTRNADGSWTLAAGDLTGLTLTPPAHWSGTLSLGVTATSSENGTTASVGANMSVTIGGAATAPSLTVGTATGTEDSAIPLSINAALVDTDGSETLAIVISNVPAGAALSAGTLNPNGTWSLTPAELAGLTLTPPAHWSGSLALDVAAISSENGTTATTHATLGVTVNGGATTPSLSVGTASGAEDTAISLPINAALVDTDGSETLAVTITSVPAGATLSAGTRNADGSWTLAPADIAGLTLTPPAHWSGTLNLNVTATSSENGTTASTSATLPVTIIGAATAPSLSVSAASGTEGQAISLAINAALNDTDGSETLSITITGVPAAGSLSAGTRNADGSWTLAPGDLIGLTFTPPADWSGSVQFGVTATSTENGSTSSVSANLPISVTGVATAPLISLSAGHGTEDQPIPLNVSVSSTDADGSDTVSVTITGVPAGASLSAGTRNADGSWSLSPADLAGLTLTPPAHWSGSLNLTVTALSTEDGTTATSQSTLPIVIDGAATPPTLSVAGASGQENQNIPLTISAGLVDTDGSETLSIVITNLPAGASLSAGTQNPDGSWTLAPGDLAGLNLIPPPHWSGTVNLGVAAISAEGTTTATTSATLPISIGGVAETPLLSAASASGTEDTATALVISAALADTDGSETLSLNVSGLPSGATLSAGTQNADGSWTLAPGDLTGLTITPPLHWSGSFNLTVTATSSENGTQAQATIALPVTINGAATPPNLSVTAASGLEDNPIALAIGASLNDTDGSETLAIRIGNVPAGATLSAGTLNPDGSWTLAPGDLAGLTLTPPAHWAGTLNLAVSAISSENGTQATVTQTLPVTIGGVATAPNLAVTGASGTEDTAIPLSISASPVDNDGSEVLSVVISGLPAGASLSAGTLNADGSWTLTPAQLSGLTFTPPAHWSGSANLTVNAVTSENGTYATTSASLPVNVSGAATAPNLSVQGASGAEDSAIPLNIAASLNDTDGSETLSLRVTGVPAGASLSAGTQNPDGSWTLAPGDLAGLTITPPAHWSGSFTLGVAAISSENGTTSTVNASLGVSVSGAATAPTLSVAAASGAEDQAIPLNIVSALVDTDGSEALSLTIAGLPAGSVLSAGTLNADGSWTLAPADLAGLTVTPPANWSGSANLTISAVSHEGSDTATTSATLPLTVTGVADAPVLSVTAATGLEDQPIALTIGAALTDTDGSELLSIRITGVPTGASLSAGTQNPDGSWTLAPADLTGLTLTPPSHASGAFTLTVTAQSSEDGTIATTTATLPVTVGGVATNPTLSVSAASGTEDTPIALGIAAALTDIDGSETLSVTIAGVPGGATLSAGTLNANGTWTLSPADLAGLTLTPPLHWSGALNLTVTATSAENGTTASVSQSLPVTVIGDATAPNLAVSAANGAEDTNVPLNIIASLADTDGSETLSLIISGVPAGATLSAGTLYPDGTWNLSPADLAGLTITPPLHWSGSFNLAVAAISIENGDIATTTTNLPVTIGGVATTPSLAVTAASGTEDVALPLAINAALVDTDGSETLSVTIAGLPTGASLSAGTQNADGSWTLTPAQLTGLTLTPPAHWSGGFNLTVTATSAENGTTATTSASLPVTIDGTATAPALSVTAATGAEDTGIPLAINAALTDTDGSETLSVVIGGIPAGAALSAGVDNGNGTWTLSPADLAGLTFTPPAHWSGSLNLTVSAISAENGTTATTSASLPITVTGAATPPALNVTTATGNEDTAIALPIVAALNDTDGSETLSLTIAGLPAGASLSAGTLNADGSWTLTPAQLSGLTLIPPTHWSGTANLTVTAIASENGTTATTTATMPLVVDGVATAPTLSVAAAAGTEDHTIPLTINAGLVDTDGSETLSVLITGLPAGAALSAGTQNPDGSWTLTPAQLTGLTFTPPLHWAGTVTLGIAAISAENGTTAQTTASLPITVAGEATTPNLSVGAANGAEDTGIPLNINASLADTDGSETLSLTIAGLPAGASLSAGTLNADGSWTLTPAQLSGLTLNPPAHWAGNFSLSIAATSSENGTTASALASLPVTVAGAATTPSLSVAAANGSEGTALPLAINAALVDTDGSETLAIVVSGLPAGATLSAGTLNADGSWTLTPAQLTNLNLIPAAGWSGAFNLTVTAISSENGTTASTQASLPATISGVATTPLLAVSSASGSEDNPVTLAIGSALVDNDGSETLSITITGVPAGATLSAGTHNPDGSWTLTQAELSGLTLSTTANWSGSFNLTVTATSSENAPAPRPRPPCRSPSPVSPMRRHSMSLPQVAPKTTRLRSASVRPWSIPTGRRR